MKSIQVHPASVALGVLGCGLAMNLMSLVQTSTQSQGPQAQAAAFNGDLIELLDHIEFVDLDDGLGGTVRTLRFSGINVQLVDGSGATNGYPIDPTSVDSGLTQTNGLGNLIIGYNEDRGGADERTGSHNLIVGQRHNYTSYGGIVGGFENDINGVYNSVVGGSNNTTSNEHTAILGGAFNVVTGVRGSISGGFTNTATGAFSTVHGGTDCISSGNFASVSGGGHHHAMGTYSWIGGGKINVTTGNFSSILGGANNVANGSRSAISGGLLNTVDGTFASINGGTLNMASGDSASVLGGLSGIASGSHSAIVGGDSNVADGVYSVVSGGQGRVISVMNSSGNTDYDWIAADLWKDF